MRGDELAGGHRAATFQAPSEEHEFVHDLKTLTGQQFMARYQVDADKYAELLTALQNGAKFAVQPRPVAAGNGSLKQAPTPIKAVVKEPQKAEYRGIAKGDNILVIRVEREHSSQFIIPESAKAKSDVGRVAAIGPKVTRAEVGELVLFDRFAAHGKEIELVDDQGIARQHLLLNDVDILLGLEKLTPHPVESAPSESSEPIAV